MSKVMIAILTENIDIIESHVWSDDYRLGRKINVWSNDCHFGRANGSGHFAHSL
jgi:hypothetical protein